MNLRRTLPLIPAILLLGALLLRPAAPASNVWAAPPASGRKDAPTARVRRQASDDVLDHRLVAISNPAATKPTSHPAVARPWRVGLQVGHWRVEERPAELEKVYGSNTGYGAVNEADLNLDIARRAEQRLEAEGVVVDLLPATVPPGYMADAVVAIHADGFLDDSPRRGWKTSAPWRASRASQDLDAALGAAYAAATGLPFDAVGVTLDMRGYYAFNYHRFTHAIAPTTPATIIELGFMSNPDDRAILLDHPERAAAGIADGVLRYLRERDPADRAALEPLDLPDARPRGSLALREAPNSGAAGAPPAGGAIVGGDQILVPFSQRDDWYFVAVRGDWNLTGWVRRDQVLPIDAAPSSRSPAAATGPCQTAGGNGC